MRLPVQLIGAAAVFMCSILGNAQEVPTISVNVKVVNVLAPVRDKHGQIVQNLKTKSPLTVQARDGYYASKK